MMSCRTRGSTITGLLFLLLLFLPLQPMAALASKPVEKPLPPAAGRVLATAYRLLEKGDAAGAVKVLEAFQNRRPAWLNRGGRDPAGYFHYMIDFTLANAYLSLGNHASAIGGYRHALKCRPDFFPAWANMAKACYESHRFPEAANAFEKAFETSQPPNDDLLFYAAVSRVSAGDNPSALKLLKKLLARHPKQAKSEWRAYLVHVLFTLKRNREALPHIEILAETTRGRRQKQWQEVCLNQYILLKQQHKGLSYARKLVRQDPAYPLWWKMLASLNIEKQRYTAALADMMICGYLAPLKPAELRLCADLSMNLDVPVQAVRFYRQAWERKKNPQTLQRLVFAWQRRHSPEKALKVLESGLQFCSGTDLSLLRARLLIDLQQYRRAKAALEALTRKDPHSGRAWLLLGYATLGLEDTAGARSAFEQAARFKDQRRSALEMLKKLPPVPPAVSDRARSPESS